MAETALGLKGAAFGPVAELKTRGGSVAAKIQVEKGAEGEFLVTVSDGRGQTSHRVSLAADYYQKLTGGKVAAEELLRKSFEFLLERESKESILREFDLKVIARYFPEYEPEIVKALTG
jgi:hypothetical protein